MNTGKEQEKTGMLGKLASVFIKKEENKNWVPMIISSATFFIAGIVADKYGRDVSGTEGNVEQSCGERDPACCDPCDDRRSSGSSKGSDRKDPLYGQTYGRNGR